MLNLRGTMIVLAALLLSMAACRNGVSSNGQSSEADSLIIAAENMVETAAEAGDMKRTIELADSFVNLNRLSSIRADFYKAMACDRQGDLPTMAEYIKKVIKAYDDDTDEDPLFYSRAAISLAGYYIYLSLYEEALNVAVPALARFEADPTIQSDWKGYFLNIIGACQKQLNRPEEAEKNFEQAYRYYLKYMGEKNFKLLDFSTCIFDVQGISMIYTGKEKIEEQKKWTDRCDSLLAWYRIQPDADSAFAERMDGQIALKRAEILINQGKIGGAAKAYEKFLKTSYSKTDEARIRSCAYLSWAGRNADAADIYQDLDRIAAKVGMKPNLEFITNYLFPKFNVNYKSDRSDSALTIAVKIASLIDSAVAKHKGDAAAELATIYETQKKEAQIARQQTELSHQRMAGLFVAVMALVVFYVVIDIYRRRTGHRLARINAAKERIENELQIARDIQMSMVPGTFPNREGLDMYATMTPAKQVGGDLYDYILSNDRLYFAVGDVSGKGVPASLFMAQATQLFRTLAAQQMMPAEICNHMNNAFTSDNNESGMFVTFFIGLIDLTTGHLDFCNAGHNPPVIGGGDRQGEFLVMESNAPFGLWPELEYVGEQIDTIMGRPLFVYTDGLNEAENQQQEQFGDDHMLNLLRQSQFASARQTIETMADAVSQHRNGAEPNDDLTMMCICLTPQGYSMRKELKIKNQKSELDRVECFVEEIGEELELDMELQMNFNLVLEEMVSNVIFYAYPEGVEDMIELTAESDGKVLTFLLSDHGREFDPTQKEAPNLDTSPAERAIGGLGIFIVKNIMDEVTYQRLEGRNLLTLKKVIAH